MSRINSDFLTIHIRYQFINTAMIPLFRENGRTVLDRILTQKTGIVTIKRIIRFSPLFQRFRNTVAKTGVFIIPHLAQHHKIGIDSGNFIR